MHLTHQHTSRILLTLLAIPAATLVAACGSSGSSSSSSSTASSAASGTGSAQFAKYQSCLKSHGVTVPTGNFRRPSGSGKAGRFTPPGGEAGTGPSGGSGTPPTGAFKGKRPAGGGFPRGAGGKVSKKQQAALKACAKDMPAGARGFAGRGGAAGGTAGGQFSAATIEKFAACVKKNGYTLPKANTSGSGPIYPRSIESNKQFVAASKSCQSLLQPSGAPAGAGASG